MKTGFSLCGNNTQGKPCSGPVRDCSVGNTDAKYIYVRVDEI